MDSLLRRLLLRHKLSLHRRLLLHHQFRVYRLLLHRFFVRQKLRVRRL